jgi:hypothetical protein
MRPSNQPDDRPGQGDRFAQQPPAASEAVLVMEAAPDGDTDGQELQPGGPVWDQPLPWARPLEPGERDRARQPQPAPAEAPAEAEESPAAEAVAVGGEEGAEAGDPQEAASAQAAPADAALARTEPDRESSPSPQRRRGAHAVLAPLRAGAAGGHAIPKGLLAVAVAAAALLAVLGGIEGIRAHSSTDATAKQEAGPLPNAVEGGAANPAPPSMSPSAHPGAKKSPARTPPVITGSAGQALAGRPGSDLTTGAGSHTSPHPPAAKAAIVKQGQYLAVGTSVDAPNSYWSQSTITVRTTTKLKALKVVLRLHQTGGVANTGTWTSLGDKVTVHSAAASQEVDYVVTLNSGVTVNPGTYTFEFQYDHAEGTRSTSRDLYAVVATASGSGDTEDRQGHY